MEKNRSRASRVVSQSKADKLVEAYHELGFVSPDDSRGVSHPEKNLWLAPLSFLPHIEYTVSSVVGGF